MEIGFISTHIDIGMGGISTYSSELMKGMSKVDTKNRYHLIHGTHNNSELYKANGDILIESYLPNYIWRFTAAPIALRKLKNLDIVHDPYDIGPLSFKMPFKTIITVHDLAYYVFPRNSYLKNIVGHAILLKHTLTTVDKIIAVSNSTKNDLINYFKIPAEKIVVIYHGVNEGYKIINEDLVNKTKQKYGINFNYVLYVGSLEKRKNIQNLIKSIYKIKKMNTRYKFEHKLLIVGKFSKDKNHLMKLIEKLNLQKDIVFTGFVSEKDLSNLYNGADLFVYPSTYEGFGLPPLESMSCGTPVITSNTSSLPEVVSGAGIMIDPYDIDLLAHKIVDVLTEDGLKEEMIKKGLKRSKLFSWEKCAKDTLKAYENI